MSKKQQFRFESNYDYQLDAIASVVDLFDGLGKISDESRICDEIFANVPEGEGLEEHFLYQNLLTVQDRNNKLGKGSEIIPSSELVVDDGMVLEGTGNDSVRVPHFTVEMETGTGKTYVYFRTIHELSQRHGFKKFIIVVPSIAIFEGVIKTFQITKQHFRSLYGNENAIMIDYDGGKPERIRDFATIKDISIMIMTRDAFNKTSNNFYKFTEKLQGERKPYQWVQETRPIVILDEPQNMSSAQSQEAIRTLKPLFVVRYSATHRVNETPNTVYRLTPVDAFRQNLVKQIQVIGITQLGNLNVPLLRLESVTRKPITAKVRALQIKKGITSEQVVTLKQGSDLHKLTGREEYKGYIVSAIKLGKDGENPVIEFEGGETVSYSDEVLGSRTDVFRAQIEKTIEAHMERQLELRKDGIKVLSLFFIDRVANFTAKEGIIRTLFDESFDRIKKKFDQFKDYSAAEVREGYFAKSKTGTEVDSDELSSSDRKASEKAAYELIMKKKEQLLSFSEPVSFIFAHSALKEGWDNPNVFQICTLNKTHSTMKKRQEIGRGLRLCVRLTDKGDLVRVTDSDVNILTVIANESYESYVGNLQREYDEDGYGDGVPTPSKPEDGQAKRNNKLFSSNEFKSFWAKLNQKMSYTITVDSDALIAESVKRLNTTKFPEPVLLVTKGVFVVREYTLKLESATSKKAKVRLIYKDTLGSSTDSVRDLEKETDLAKILKDENLRGYKVMDILTIGSDWKVKFTNGVEVTTTQPHYFKTEKAKKTDPTIRESSEQTYPVFDVIGRVADETNLTRKSVLQIYKGLSDSQKSLLFKNPEGWTGHFLAQIKGALCDHVAERIVFSANPEAETSYDENELFKDIVIIPQRELIAAGPRGLYDKVQIDSEVERDFVRKSVMADEDHVVVYFKFPPSFKIRLPKIIGNYNPDWAIVRRDNEGQLTLQLVRETKGGLNLEELQFPQEKRKIRCAQRHFATLGISYRVVTGNTPRWWEDDPDLNHQLDLVVTESRMAKLSLVPPADREHWVNCIPVISDLKIAAGYWSDEQALDIEDPAWAEEWMALPESVKVEKGMFVAPIQGLSMQPLVNDGDWCLFRPAQAGSRNGKRVLVWHAGTADSETGNAFTFKEYHSEKASDGDSWAHTKITLHPLNKDFDPIVLTPEEESSVRVIAEFVQVIEQKATSPKTKTKADISVDQESGENEDDLDDSEEIRNEKASIKPVSITQIEDYKIICAIRSAMVSGGARSRAELIKDVATELGYARTGQKITEVIDNKIKTAVGRKILINEGGLISIYARSIDGYDRETIREQFLKSLSRSWIEREKAIRDFARWMGFSRTGEAIESMAKSLIMGLLMTKNIESSGSMIRRL